MQRHELEKLSREELIAHAERLNVPRPRVLTQPELMDEIIARTAPSDRERARSRGWLGKARDLLARVIEQGLHLPDAARAIRTSPSAARSWPAPPPPLPTVTLAEIYAAQGHLERAAAVLDEVIAREPDHKEARELRERFVDQTQRTRARSPRVTDTGRAEASSETATPKQQPPPEIEAAAPKQQQQQQQQQQRQEQEEEAAPPMEAIAFAAESEPAVIQGTEEASSVQAPEEAKTSSVQAPKEINAPEPVREEPAVAAENAGPVTERDMTLAPAAEAKPEESAANAEESAAEAESASEANEEIDETIVDGEAVAELAERLRAQGMPAEQEPAEQEPAEQEPAEEEELPEGYDVDEIVAIAVDPETIYVYWEVRAVTLARALARRPSGRLALRIASISPSWDGPLTRTWDLHIDALFGDRFVRDIPHGSNVRMSVGWLDGASFEPFAIGAEVVSPRIVPSAVEAHDVGHWIPEIRTAASPLDRAPKAYRTPDGWAPEPQGLGLPARRDLGATSAASASPLPLSAGRPAPGLTSLAPLEGSGPGIDRATRAAELARSYFRTVAGSYLRSGASDLIRGGASDLAWGGASDLARVRNA